ncbi:MAG: ComF family protein [Pseudomonadota bacterium]
MTVWDRSVASGLAVASGFAVGVGQAFGRWAGTALDLVVPPLCMGCRRPIADPRTLCGRCWPQLELIAPPICDIMGTPLAFDAGPGARAPELSWNHPLYDKARAATVFGPLSRRLVHQLKYCDVPGVAALMARLMAPAVVDVTTGADLLLPVPLHRRRLIARRFNQAVQIADALSAHTGLPVARHAMKRVRATPRQVALNRQQRSDNLYNAFKVVDHDAISGKHIVIVDDVLTTGATADAMAMCLRGAGARSVRVAVFARVVPEDRDPR